MEILEIELDVSASSGYHIDPWEDSACRDKLNPWDWFDPWEDSACRDKLDPWDWFDPWEDLLVEIS